jgi:phage terminase large subunit-like protein
MTTVGPRLPRLRKDQWDFASHPAKTKVGNLGRRWGKTTTGGTVCVAGAWHGARAAWIVPTYKNGHPLWRFTMDAVKDLRGTAYCHVSKADRRVEFPASDGSLAIYTAESADSIRGEAFHIVVVDEAARCGGRVLRRDRPDGRGLGRRRNTSVHPPWKKLVPHFVYRKV